jgi:hypothetical protein
MYIPKKLAESPLTVKRRVGIYGVRFSNGVRTLNLNFSPHLNFSPQLKTSARVSVFSR